MFIEDVLNKPGIFLDADGEKSNRGKKPDGA